MVIAHRGSLDALGFWCYQGRKSENFWDTFGISAAVEFERYAAVLLLRTTAESLPNIYKDYRRKTGRGSPDEAIHLEACLERAWQSHPRFFAIGNQWINWVQKVSLSKDIIDAMIPAREPLARKKVNESLEVIKYPSSHQYTIESNGKILPCQAGSSRIKEVRQVLGDGHWDSLLDIGCSKGMFLLWAIQEFNLRRAVGIDAAPDMVLACRKAVDFLQAPATILLGSLDHLLPVLPPADLVFLFHCYHHLYFGSPFGTPGLPSHDRWFEMLAGITKDILLFANPLKLSKEKCEAYRQGGILEEDLANYNADAILKSAARYFDIHQFELGGGRPYIRMQKKGSS
jgi:hypothetical protein